MKLYVCGFYFDDSGNVLLLKKAKPSWQRGKLNGIGGSVEKNESLIDAMCREFIEETGLATLPEDWEQLAIMFFDDSVIWFYYSKGESFVAKSLPDEPCYWISLKTLSEEVDIFGNLKWLIPLAVDRSVKLPLHLTGT